MIAYALILLAGLCLGYLVRYGTEWTADPEPPCIGCGEHRALLEDLEEADEQLGLATTILIARLGAETDETEAEWVIEPLNAARAALGSAMDIERNRK